LKRTTYEKIKWIIIVYYSIFFYLFYLLLVFACGVSIRRT